MINRILSKEEEKIAISLSTLLEKQNYTQTLAVNELAIHKSVVATFSTGSGKTFIAIKAIQRCSEKFGGSYIVVVPDRRLSDVWKKFLKNIPNVYVYVVHSFTMKDVYIPNDVLMCIYDECHHYLSKDNIYFSTAISKIDCKYKLLLSATLSENHLKYCEELGVKLNFSLPIIQAFKIGLVAEFKFYNIPVEFTPKEKMEFLKIQNEYKNYLYKFEQYIALFPNANVNYAAYLAGCVLKDKKGKTNKYKWEGRVFNSSKELATDIATKLNIGIGSVYYFANKWQVEMGKRCRLYYNAENKLKLANQLLELISSTEKVVVFNSNKRNADALTKLGKGRQSYYSGKDSSDILKKFQSGEFPVLNVVKKADEGDLDDEVSIGINLFHVSTQTAINQRLGRLCRKDKNNPNKIGFLISIYVDDFYFGEERMYSSDLNWLRQSLKNSKFITFIESIEEIEELYETI